MKINSTTAIDRSLHGGPPSPTVLSRTRPVATSHSPMLLKTIYELPSATPNELPQSLAELYDGDLGLDGPRVFANFVTSIDGVVAIPSVPASSSLISLRSEADRFVMGLLRAHADVVLVGAGTVRAEPQHQWTPEFIYPRLAEDFARVRTTLGLPAHPRLAVITSRGDLEPGMPALDGALVLTTTRGAEQLKRRGLSGATILDAGDGDALAPEALIAALRSEGHGAILSEGGPTVIGQLLERRLLEDLFLTISPVLIGRGRPEARPGLVEGVDLLGDGPPETELVSIRKHRSHIFLRYSVVRRQSQLQQNAA
jgi:riboflavin biosynthesis pyrimidine reductase